MSIQDGQVTSFEIQSSPELRIHSTDVRIVRRPALRDYPKRGISVQLSPLWVLQRIAGRHSLHPCSPLLIFLHHGLHLPPSRGCTRTVHENAVPEKNEIATDSPQMLGLELGHSQCRSRVWRAGGAADLAVSESANAERTRTRRTWPAINSQQHGDAVLIAGRAPGIC